MNAYRLNTYQQKMTKKKLIQEIHAKLLAERPPVTSADISAVIDALVESVSNALGHGGTVTIPSLGRFETRLRKSRTYKDALTETIYDLGERYTPFFVPSRRLKKRVAQRPYAHHRPYNRAAETRRRVEQRRRLYDDLEDEY